MCIASLNNQPCQVTSKIVDVNTNKPPYYSLAININNCSGSKNI